MNEACSCGSGKVAVLLCECEGVISASVDLEEVRKAVAANPCVVRAVVRDSLCSDEGRAAIRQLCEELNPFGIVIGACSPEAVGVCLKSEVERGGMNPYLCEQVDLREQCACVHPSDSPSTVKATSLIRGGIARCLKDEPLEDLSFPIEGAALIVGGAEEGARAAKRIADAGFEAYLIDESPRVDEETAQTDAGTGILSGIEGVEILKDSIIEGIQGPFGARVVRTRVAGGSREFVVGTILVILPEARGVEGSDGDSGIRRAPVMTTEEFEDYLVRREDESRGNSSSHETSVGSISFVQRFRDIEEGGRDVHVQSAFIALAVSQALRFKRISPSTDIGFYTHDSEGLLRTARGMTDSAERAGIVFQTLQSPAEISLDAERPCARVSLIGESDQRVIESDLIVLVGDGANRDNTPKAVELLHIGSGEGRTINSSAEWHAEDLNRGIFVVRTSVSEDKREKAMADVDAASAAMIDIMQMEKARIPRRIARVDEYRCRGCGRCRDICEHDAIEIIQEEEGEQVARVDELRCEGCGLCRVACCNGAMALLGFTTTQMRAQMLGLLEVNGS